MKNTFFLFVARFAETIGLGLFVNALYGFQTSGVNSSALLIMAESVVIIFTSILCYAITNKK